MIPQIIAGVVGFIVLLFLVHDVIQLIKLHDARTTIRDQFYDTHRVKGCKICSMWEELHVPTATGIYCKCGLSPLYHEVWHPHRSFDDSCFEFVEDLGFRQVIL